MSSLRQNPQPRQRLPLLRLPFLAQEMILKDVDPIDLVRFSFLSKRARNIAKAVRFTKIKDVDGILSLGKLHVDFRKNYVSVRVQDSFLSGAVRVEVSERTRNRPNVLNPKMFHREGVWRNGGMTESNLVANFSRSRLHEAARIVIEYLCSLFRIPVGSVTVNVNDIPNFSKLFIWDLLKGSCADVQLYGMAVQNGEVNKFFKKFEVKERLVLEVGNHGNMMTHFDKIKNNKLLVLWNAKWMQDHHFEQLNCEYLEVRDTQVTPQAVNRWFKKWMDSSETHIKVMVISSGHAVRYHFSNVLVGIEYHSGSEFKEEQTGKFGSFTRSYFEGPRLRRTMIPMRDVATLTRADGAVAKIGKEGTELCAYMTYP